MEDFLMGVVVGLILTLSAFVYFGCTPQVDYEDTLRAVHLCKDGKWKKINNSTITCSDSAKYDREQEGK